MSSGTGLFRDLALSVLRVGSKREPMSLSSHS